MFKIIQFMSLGNRVATILRKKLPVPFVHFVAAKMYFLYLPLVLGGRCGSDCVSS